MAHLDILLVHLLTIPLKFHRLLREHLDLKLNTHLLKLEYNLNGSTAIFGVITTVSWLYQLNPITCLVNNTHWFMSKYFSRFQWISPSYMWRSVPNIALLVIFTITSSWLFYFRIFNYLHFTFFFPLNITSFMDSTRIFFIKKRI